MPVKDRKENDFFNVCSQCMTSCCINARPPLTRKRTRTIRAYLREQRIPTKEPFVQASYTFPREDSEGYCIFNDRKTGKCKIHAVKPETCVAGPVTFDVNAKTGKIEWHLKKDTICPLAGRLYLDKARLEEHLALAKSEINALVTELDGEALSAILKIEEPDTFKIGEEAAEKGTLNKLSQERS